MATAIEFNNISKQYRLGLVSTRTLGSDLNRWWAMNVRHKEDPYLKVGSVNDRSLAADSEFVWALRDIDFKVNQGEVVGIIGKNGAGKSTLLKLLSKVTAPTTGTIKANGRIASLLEVGTGFHPEMTGRENIYLNGAILGMTKTEITSKLDEIVDFAGIERYIDTPTKRYSSGMTVRLGFAIAAHLDPEILVVDEVLAVGDAEFQKKAIGKMQEVSHGEGRTVLFVSHNMDSVRNLCAKGIILQNGMIDYQGTADSAVERYISNNMNDRISSYVCIDGVKHRKRGEEGILRKLEFVDVRILNDPNSISTDEPLLFDVTVKRNVHSVEKCQCSIIFSDMLGKRVATFVSAFIRLPDSEDMFKIRLRLDNHSLARRKYTVRFDIGIKDYGSSVVNYDSIFDTICFDVTQLKKDPVTFYSTWGDGYGYILNDNMLSAEVL